MDATRVHEFRHQATRSGSSTFKRFFLSMTSASQQLCGFCEVFLLCKSSLLMIYLYKNQVLSERLNHLKCGSSNNNSSENLSRIKIESRFRRKMKVSFSK